MGTDRFEDVKKKYALQRRVRFVFHMFLSTSVEGYYQEAGRAGRDGKMSRCVVFFSQKDVNTLSTNLFKDAATVESDGRETDRENEGLL